MSKQRKNLIVDGNNLLYASVASTDKYFENNPTRSRKKNRDGGDIDSLQSFLYYLYNLINGGLPKINLVEGADHSREFFDTHWSSDSNWDVWVYVCWDRKLKVDATNWRKDIYPPYKENRKSDPSKELMAKKVRDLSKSLKSILETIGVNSIFPYTSEADDIIHYLAKNLEGENIIYTADKDMYQCVDERTSVYNFYPKNRFIVNQETWDQHVPVSIENYCKYKAIMGDSSDNISGIKGYGPVKTKKLLENWDKLSSKLSDEDLEEINETLKIVDLSWKPLEKKERRLISAQTIPITKLSDWDITIVFEKYGLDQKLQELWEPFFRLK